MKSELNLMKAPLYIYSANGFELKAHSLILCVLDWLLCGNLVEKTKNNNRQTKKNIEVVLWVYMCVYKKILK